MSLSARPASISRTVAGSRMDFCWRPARTWWGRLLVVMFE